MENDITHSIVVIKIKQRLASEPRALNSQMTPPLLTCEGSILEKSDYVITGPSCGDNMMEMFALLALCEGNPPVVTGGSPHKGPVMQS